MRLTYIKKLKIKYLALIKSILLDKYLIFNEINI